MDGKNGITIPWEELSPDLLSDLTCPGCKNYFKAPIYFCSKGHSCCNTCKEKSKLCVTCNRKFSGTKNLSLESIVSTLNLPVACKHVHRGCDAKEAHQKMWLHEKECCFRDVTCGIPTCKIIVQFKALADHLIAHHGAIDGKWKSVTHTQALKIWKEKDGLQFVALVYQETTTVGFGNPAFPVWKVWVIVMAEKSVADNYRTEIRMTSADGGFTQSFNGSVISCDVQFMNIPPINFLEITPKIFQAYNEGNPNLDGSKVDKLGEQVFPFSVQVRKRELRGD